MSRPSFFFMALMTAKMTFHGNPRYGEPNKVIHKGEQFTSDRPEWHESNRPVRQVKVVKVRRK